MILPHNRREHDTTHPTPRGNVLLLTCMDLRLLDEIVEFMANDNLENRYDHVVFAGAAAGAVGAPGATDADGKPLCFDHWKSTFKDHLGAAVELHDIRDVYILEHRDCGAYRKVFRYHTEEFGDSDDDRRCEDELHAKYARLLEKKIVKWHPKLKGHVHKFIMDLRGTVDVLGESSKPAPAVNGKPAKKKKVR